MDTRDELPDLIMDVIARVKERRDAPRRTKRHVLARGAKCVDVDVGFPANALHYVKCTDVVTCTVSLDIRNNTLYLFINNFVTVD